MHPSFQNGGKENFSKNFANYKSISECSWAGGSSIEWNKRWLPPFPCYPLSRHCPWKKNLIEKNRDWRKVSAIKKLFFFPRIFFKANPLRAQISLFSLILVAGTYQKRDAKEKRYIKRNKPCHHNINVHLFNKMSWKSWTYLFIYMWLLLKFQRC